MRLIDADNLISVLDILSDKGGDIRYWEQLKMIVADCPTADVVKHGRWIRENRQISMTCSECGALIAYGTTTHNYNYCPMCGAKMESKNVDM